MKSTFNDYALVALCIMGVIITILMAGAVVNLSLIWRVTEKQLEATYRMENRERTKTAGAVQKWEDATEERERFDSVRISKIRKP